MPVKPSSRFRGIPEVEDGRKNLIAIAKGLTAKGIKVITIGGGDPVQFGFVNQRLSEALIQAAKNGLHMYSYWTTYGNDLKEAIVRFEKRYRHVDYSPEDIILTPGVAGAFMVIHYALLDAGDEIVALEPSHYLTEPTSYFSLLGSKVRSCRTIEKDNWKPDLKELRARINEKTKAIVIVNPNNPTGTVYEENVLREIVNIAGEYDLLVISDEIYSLLTFDDEVRSIASIANDVPTITLSGMSKIFMCTGWRVGYICFHDPQGKMTEVIKAIKKMATLYGHPSSSIPTPILCAAIEAYRGSVDEAKEMMRQLQPRRDFAFKRLNEIEGISCTKPKGAFYAFPRVHAIGKIWKTEIDFLTDLLKEEHILFSFPGSIFGKSGYAHFRVLLLPKLETLEEVFNRLERFIARRTAK